MSEEALKANKILDDEIEILIYLARRWGSAPDLDSHEKVDTAKERVIACTESTVTALRAQVKAAKALQVKLDRIVESDSFKGVFQIAAIHHCEYRGETFEHELTALRNALAATEEEVRKIT